jgi:hypothetical protein
LTSAPVPDRPRSYFLDRQRRRERHVRRFVERELREFLDVSSRRGSE